jgi:hypothetical protein
MKSFSNEKLFLIKADEIGMEWIILKLIMVSTRNPQPTSLLVLKFFHYDKFTKFSL